MKKLILILTPLLLLAACSSDYAVERSVVIDAPKAQVWDQIKYYENWKNWSPWYAKDTTMIWSFEGEDGTEGSSYTWTSTDQGAGKMTNTGVTELEEMNYHTHFTDPWDSETDGYLRLEDAEGGTKVYWGFSGKMGFPMSLFMNMDEMVGPDFEAGLDMLKTTVENTEIEAPKSEISVIDFKGGTYVGIKKEIGFEEMDAFFSEVYGNILGSGITMGEGHPSAVYYSWDPENMRTEVAAVIPVSEVPETLAEGIEVFTFDEGKAVHYDYYGDYSDAEDAHIAIEEYISTNDLDAKGMAFEVYVTSPNSDPDADKWSTQIYYLLN